MYKNIRDLREDSDITQSEVAGILGIAQNTYSQYETGKISFTADMLVCLANYYRTSIDYLLGQTDNKEPLEK
jgi:transcriptional regulator with XRE-family HTH domain